MTLGVQLCKFGLPQGPPWGRAEHRWLIWHVIPGSRGGVGGEIEKRKANAKVHYRGHCCEQLGFGCIRNTDAKSTDCLPRGPGRWQSRFIHCSSLMSWNLVPEALTLAASCCSWRAPGQDEENPRLRAQSGISDPPPQWYALCGTSFPAQAKISEESEGFTGGTKKLPIPTWGSLAASLLIQSSSGKPHPNIHFPYMRSHSAWMTLRESRPFMSECIVHITAGV